MNRLVWVAFLSGVYVLPAQAVCPNAASTLTIPLSGTATVTIYDQSCNALPVSSISVVQGNNVPVNGTTIPSVTTPGGVLTFTSNGAAPGLTGTLKFTYTPAGQSVGEYGLCCRSTSN